jgi:enoyl-CoA hydratase
VNAVSQPMYLEIQGVFDRLVEEAPDARAVILTGAGPHFCAGNDLHDFETLTPENCAARMLEVRKAFWAIHDCELPVIAAVRGSALGTGLALAASCDFVVAAEGALFGLPELSVGVMGGARHLARLVPEPLVRWMFYSADPVPAERFADLGAVIDVVPGEELLERARAHAERIVRHSPIALRLAKRTLNAIETMDLKPGYEYEQEKTGELCGHPDAKQAVRAFFERREPRYAGDSA